MRPARAARRRCGGRRSLRSRARRPCRGPRGRWPRAAGPARRGRSRTARRGGAQVSLPPSARAPRRVRRDTSGLHERSASELAPTPHSPCAPTTSSSAPVPATTRPSICSPGRRRSPPRPRPRRRRACTRPRSGCCPRAMPSATRRCSRRAPRRSHRPGACTRAGRPTSRPPRCWRRTRRSGSCTWRAARRWRTSWGSTARPAAGWSARSPRCPTQRPPDRVPRWRRSSGSRPSSPTTRRRCATGRRARCHVELALRGFTTMPDELVAAWPESA